MKKKIHMIYMDHWEKGNIHKMNWKIVDLKVKKMNTKTDPQAYIVCVILIEYSLCPHFPTEYSEVKCSS